MKPAGYPFRLGTTSYILPADILQNVRALADEVDDIELLLFEMDASGSDLPSAETVDELARIARASGLTFTVHWPLDLWSGADGGPGSALDRAKMVIERTRPLAPWAHVLHLPEAGDRSSPKAEQVACADRCARDLRELGHAAGGADRLAVENLEGDRPDHLDPVLERVALSRCVDVGHLWLDGRDPVPHLGASLGRTRVIHLHGVADRDHRSLAHAPCEELDRVIALLLRQEYRGVLTLEVFNQEDLHSSRKALEESLRRVWRSG